MNCVRIVQVPVHEHVLRKTVAVSCIDQQSDFGVTACNNDDEEEVSNTTKAAANVTGSNNSSINHNHNTDNIASLFTSMHVLEEEEEVAGTIDTIQCISSPKEGKNSSTVAHPSRFGEIKPLKFNFERLSSISSDCCTKY